MQILRRLPLACAAAMILSPLLVRADDNEAQIRSRQALEQKMQEMQSESVTSTPPAAATQPEPAKPKKTKKPKPTPPPAQPTAEQPVVSQPAPAPTKPATRPAEMPVYSAAPNTTSGDLQDEKLQQALQEKMSETQPPSQATQKSRNEKKTASAPVVMGGNPTIAPTPTAPPIPSSLAPLQGPPSSLSGSKQQKLDQLLQQYRADQITPTQYHEQRAKILSEP